MAKGPASDTKAEKETADESNGPSAVSVKTAYAETAGKKIAYRSIGEGDPIVLCNRFRGILDSWDPEFLDKLAKKNQVIIFDYSGVGLSSGELPTEMAGVAEDIKALSAFLGFKKIIILGWSYGGMVAQTFSTLYPDLISHTILIGTTPPGKNGFATEKIFTEISSKPANDLDDETILFFEPQSKLSRHAAKHTNERIAERINDKDTPVSENTQARYQQGGADFVADKLNAREKIGKLKTPLLVISGDHDIAFPVENWYALTRKQLNLQIIMVPQAGHAPQHQYPALTAKYIAAFIKHAKV